MTRLARLLFVGIAFFLAEPIYCYDFNSNLSIDCSEKIRFIPLIKQEAKVDSSEDEKRFYDRGVGNLDLQNIDTHKLKNFKTKDEKINPFFVCARKNEDFGTYFLNVDLYDVYTIFDPKFWNNSWFTRFQSETPFETTDLNSGEIEFFAVHNFNSPELRYIGSKSNLLSKDTGLTFVRVYLLACMPDSITNADWKLKVRQYARGLIGREFCSRFLNQEHNKKSNALMAKFFLENALGDYHQEAKINAYYHLAMLAVYDKNMPEAKKYFKILENEADTQRTLSETQFNLGLIFLKEKNYDEALKRFMHLSQYRDKPTNTNQRAIINYGYMLANGYGVEQDIDAAILLIEKVYKMPVSKQLEMKAALMFGDFYIAQRNLSAARTYYELVANQNEEVEFQKKAKKRLKKFKK